MSIRYFGFYFSCNADRSTNDYTVYVEMKKFGSTVKLAPRYKNIEANNLYEIEMDEDDLRLFGQMCIEMANAMKLDRQSSQQGAA